MNTVRFAAAILVAYMTFFLVVSVIICRVENVPLLTAMFETASAIGTVGLTLGITPHLGLLSKCLLMFLMFFGRIGGLTLILAALPSSDKKIAKYPEENVNVG